MLDFLDKDGNGSVVYDDPIVHHHAPKNDYNLIRKIKETPSIHPTVISELLRETPVCEGNIFSLEENFLLRRQETNMSPLSNVEEEFEEQITEEEVSLLLNIKKISLSLLTDID